MRELTNDSFYELIKEYNRCIIDYCLCEDDVPYKGEWSHRKAILFAIYKVMERDMEHYLKTEMGWNQSMTEAVDDESLSRRIDIGRARAERISPDAFLYVPNRIGEDKRGNPRYDCEMPNAMGGEQIPYWYAFWNTPHGTGYGPEEFQAFNEILFPNGTDLLEVYEWTTDWSDYFDAGHEWWGTACWSVYDNLMNRFVVILASTTD